MENIHINITLTSFSDCFCTKLHVKHTPSTPLLTRIPYWTKYEYFQSIMKHLAVVSDSGIHLKKTTIKCMGFTYVSSPFSYIYTHTHIHAYKTGNMTVSNHGIQGLIFLIKKYNPNNDNCLHLKLVIHAHIFRILYNLTGAWGTKTLRVGRKIAWANVAKSTHKLLFYNTAQMTKQHCLQT